MESLIKLEAKKLDADIIVAGGLNDPYGTCPFDYTYIATYRDLLQKLKEYEAILYHWPVKWALLAIRDSELPCVEFVHRTDTAECDKTIPNIILSHSQYVCDYIEEKYKKECYLVPNVVDTDYYIPTNRIKTKRIGGVTSYYDTKGIDILIKAWARVQRKFPEYEFVLYGAGDKKKEYEEMAKQYCSNIKFFAPVENSKIVYDDLQMVVTASRIEGLPIALLEALSCNIPILASDIEGHKIINRLCENKGIEPPIHCFKSEDVDDLEKHLINEINSLEHGKKVNVREAALNVFSPDQHVVGIKKAIQKAKDERNNSKSKEIEYAGQFPVVLQQYLVYSNVVQEYSYEECVTNNSYLVCNIELENKIDLVSVVVDVLVDRTCNIYCQIDGKDENGKIVYTDYNGILLDSHVKKMQVAFDIPTYIKSVLISIRPNPGEIFYIINAKGEFYIKDKY